VNPVPPSSSLGGGIVIQTSDRVTQMRFTTYYFVGVVACLANVRTSAAQTSVSLVGSMRSAVLAADAQLSGTVFGANPTTVFPNAFTRSATIVWPGAPAVRDSAQLARFFAHQPLLQSVKMSWQPIDVHLSDDSSVAVISGVVVVDRLADDPVPAIHRFGRYLAAWRVIDNRWHLEMFALFNAFTAGETIWTPVLDPVDLPPYEATSRGKPFRAADSTFAASAAANGPAAAFAAWAAPDGMTFAPSGQLNIGPEAIRRALSANTAHWSWDTVAGDGSPDGSIGWTVSHGIVTSGSGRAIKVVNVALWRRMTGGALRYVAFANANRP